MWKSVINVGFCLIHRQYGTNQFYLIHLFNFSFELTTLHNVIKDDTLKNTTSYFTFTLYLSKISELLS